MTSANRGPGFGDWALFGVSILFCSIGVLMLFDEPPAALAIIGTFGAGALFSGLRIRSKRRRQAFAATSVAVAGGVELHGSLSRMGMVTGFILLVGIAPFLIPDAPLLARIAGGVALGLGGWSLYALLTGRFTRRFLRFDPLGLTINEVKYEYTVPWDAMMNVDEFDLYRNACVGITVSDPDALLFRPESMKAKVLKGFANNRALSGRDIVVMAVHYNVPAESLCGAIRNYAQDAAARADLVPKPALDVQS